MTQKTMILCLLFFIGWISPDQQKNTPSPHPKGNIRKLDTPDTGMVLIRGGYFNMGSASGKDDEKPVHRVYVSDFYIDKYEVTVEQYRIFVGATGYKTDAEKDGGSYLLTDSGWAKKRGVN